MYPPHQPYWLTGEQIIIPSGNLGFFLLYALGRQPNDVTFGLCESQINLSVLCDNFI